MGRNKNKKKNSRRSGATVSRSQREDTEKPTTLRPLIRVLREVAQAGDRAAPLTADLQ